MYDYLINLQSEYDKYTKLEDQLRSFLNKHMDGDIEQITLFDGKVGISTVEMCRGQIYHETYAIPFSYFKDEETFVNNYMKFRD